MSSSSRRPISPVKALSLVLVFLLLSTAGGILAAGFAAPELLPGEARNIKLTQPLDLKLAELLLKE